MFVGVISKEWKKYKERHVKLKNRIENNIDKIVLRENVSILTDKQCRQLFWLNQRFHGKISDTI